MVVIGCSILKRDSKSFMFRDDSSLKKCSGCGFRIDFFAHNDSYRLEKSEYDMYSTYDGQTIVSDRFREFCKRNNYKELEFLPFDNDPLHYHLLPKRTVPFDAKR